MFQDLPLIQRTNEELSRVDRLFKEAGSGEQDESRASKCGLVRAPQPAAALELHYQAESKGGASTLHGLLPSSMCSKLVKRVRGPRWPYSHSGHRAPPPRPQHAPTTRRTQPARKLPGWRPSCAQRNTCNARGGGGECPVFLALTRKTSSGQRWPRVPSPRRFASCSGRLSSAAPPNGKQSARACPSALSSTVAVKQGSSAVALAQAQAALIPELGGGLHWSDSSTHPVRFGRAPPPKRPRTFEQQLTYGLELVEGELQMQKQRETETEVQEMERGG